MVPYNVEKPVFVETNLGTRFVAVAHLDITVKDFKRELEKTHMNCFPEFGRIRVNALMVQLKSHLYHLGESFPLKYAFHDSKGTLFLQMDVHPFNFKNTKVCQNMNSAANMDSGSVIPQRKRLTYEGNKKRIENKRKEVDIWKYPFIRSSFLIFSLIIKKKKKTRRIQKDTILESRNEKASESASVSGIIEKYFSDNDEVASTPFSRYYRNSNFQPGVIISQMKGHINKPGYESSKKPEVVRIAKWLRVPGYNIVRRHRRLDVTRLHAEPPAKYGGGSGSEGLGVQRIRSQVAGFDFKSRFVSGARVCGRSDERVHLEQAFGFGSGRDGPQSCGSC
ncbi:E3 ubiquitin-protein ligase UPL1 [Striga hermonthica]|uniref:E3 ubiquitin-protein ligase UPL1 n=1 Tax=Striga hermonthica TaxID=68872 RepID=A0A9N7NLZ5_STRHE|nr:E3 ubiquitin-protein ligase UPL1 [Striga hermonthica]